MTQPENPQQHRSHPWKALTPESLEENERKPLEPQTLNPNPVSVKPQT